jgi:hypothetical protein
MSKTPCADRKRKQRLINTQNGMEFANMYAVRMFVRVNSIKDFNFKVMKLIIELSDTELQEIRAKKEEL